MNVELINGTLTKSFTVNDDGEVVMEIENNGSPMNQTIVIESKPLESVEAFGVKASSSNIGLAVMAVLVIIVCCKLLKKWY